MFLSVLPDSLLNQLYSSRIYLHREFWDPAVLLLWVQIHRRSGHFSWVSRPKSMPQQVCLSINQTAACAEVVRGRWTGLIPTKGSKPTARPHLSLVLKMLFQGPLCVSTMSIAGRSHRACPGHHYNTRYRTSIHLLTHLPAWNQPIKRGQDMQINETSVFLRAVLMTPSWGDEVHTHSHGCGRRTGFSFSCGLVIGRIPLGTEVATHDIQVFGSRPLGREQTGMSGTSV